MQSLDVISINLWQMLVSLVNLVLLFLIIKKFLYKPVKNMLANRQRTIDGQYSDAEAAKEQALLEKKMYEDKLSEAKAEADGVIRSAVNTANLREQEILKEAKIKADGIVRQAEVQASLELKKAEESIKTEIVDVSTRLAEKMLEREIKAEDHKELIDSFIDKIGEQDDRN